jgi:hypothetical protein
MSSRWLDIKQPPVHFTQKTQVSPIRERKRK